MLGKRWFDDLTKALVLAALLCGSAQIVLGQAASVKPGKTVQPD
jgi:hypothetical protein